MVSISMRTSGFVPIVMVLRSATPLGRQSSAMSMVLRLPALRAAGDLLKIQLKRKENR